MSNSFYNAGSFPATGAPGTSASMRAELAFIAAGFDKLPTLAGNGNKLVTINAGGTALTVLTPPSGDLVGTTATQTLTNKTISGSSNTLSNIANASLVNSALTIGSTSISLGATSTTLAGLTSVTSTSFVGALTGNASTATTLQSSRTIWGQAFNGSANVVGALSGVTDIAASGSVTLSGGTANGVLYLNGSKVATSGSALTFDGANLQVGGGASGAIVTINGNANGGSLRGQRSGANHWFIGDTASALGSGTGLINFVYGNDPFIWYNAGVAAEQMRLTSTGLGIGTSSPGAKLHVVGGNGNTLFLDNTGQQFTQLDFKNSGTTKAQAYFDNTGNSLNLFTNTAGSSIVFGTVNTTRATLDSSGNLGLGVTPSAWSQGRAIEVFGQGYGIWNGTSSIYSIANAYFNSGFKYANTGEAASHYYQFQGSHVWSTAPSGTAGNAISFTQAMTLDASGDLALGGTSVINGARADFRQNSNGNYSTTFTTATTKALLHLRDLSDVATYPTTFSTLLFGAGDSGAAYTTITCIRESSQNSAIAFGTASGSSNTTERARIDSSGNLLVGKTAANPAIVGVEARGSGFVASTLAGSTSATDTLEVYSTGAGAFRFYVTMDGKINCTSTTIAAISDQRLKENVQDIDVGLNAIMALKPRKFDWKAGKGKDIKGDRGWIAQEFEQVFPEMIHTWKDTPPSGEEPYKSVAADLIPVLVKAIQELKAEFDAYKATHP